MAIDIKHLAKLARLTIDEDKLVAFESDMENIVNMIEEMPTLKGDISGLDPQNPMVLRKDVAEVGKYTRKEILANAPRMQAGCVVVPRTVE